MQAVTDWFKRYLSNPQVVFLSLALVAVFAVVLVIGDMIGPILASIIIAYLLEGIVRPLEKKRIPRFLSVVTVYFLFLAFIVVVVFGLLPLLSRQLKQLFDQIPIMIGAGRQALLQLPSQYPEYVSAQQIDELITGIGTELAQLGQAVVSLSWSSVIGLITLIVYIILVPLLVFFFMKDKQRILDWFKGYIPQNYQLAKEVWGNMDIQIGNYVRGKFWEIIIVWAATYVTFVIMKVPFAMLLSVVIGLSVLIPFVGAAVVTIPVVLIAGFEFGWTQEAAMVVLAHLIIQGIDGNIVVPLLFSEVVDLHPIAIIAAVLVFGGLWGVWGVFFAIPLATLVNAVLNAWPRGTISEMQSNDVSESK